LSDYRGLSVAEMTALRRKIRESGAQMLVVKNTLTRLAAREAGIQDLDDLLKGPTAVAFAYEDEVTLSKLMAQFQKEYREFELKGGVLQGRVIPVESVQRLADLPPRDVLMGQVAGTFQAPIAGLVHVLQGNIRKLVYVLEAVREKKAAGE
ncbi:MAG: 50S ribosomal protein L10, partial [Candidatus Desulforudis sp.]|nr:50S ribosomal protein L10 [Desulforudis sp.]